MINTMNYAGGGNLSVEEQLELDKAFDYLQEYLPKNHLQRITKITTAERKLEK